MLKYQQTNTSISKGIKTYFRMGKVLVNFYDVTIDVYYRHVFVVYQKFFQIANYTFTFKAIYLITIMVVMYNLKL